MQTFRKTLQLGVPSQTHTNHVMMSAMRARYGLGGIRKGGTEVAKMTTLRIPVGHKIHK